MVDGSCFKCECSATIIRRVLRKSFLGFGVHVDERRGRLAERRVLGRHERHHLLEGLRFRVQGVGFRIQGSGCRVQGAGCRVHGLGFRVDGMGLQASGFGFRVVTVASADDDCSLRLPASSPNNTSASLALDRSGKFATWFTVRGLRFGFGAHF